MNADQRALLDGLFSEFPDASDGLILVVFEGRSRRTLSKTTVMERRKSLGLPARRSSTPLGPDQLEILGRLVAEAEAEHGIPGSRSVRVAGRFAAETGRRIAPSTAFNFARRAREESSS
jgi:hypothetical protein